MCIRDRTKTEKYGVCLYNASWHQGVVGIIASRIKDRVHRPTIAFAKVSDTEIKGSARSIHGLHIRDALDAIATANPGLIDKFGGHAMAAGLSIAKQDFEKFQQLFAQTAERWLDTELLEGKLYSDGELSVSEMNLPFAELLRNAGPWGQNFPEPLFDDEFILVQQRIVGEKHLKIVVQKNGQLFDGIAFNVDVKKWPNTPVSYTHLTLPTI